MDTVEMRKKAFSAKSWHNFFVRCVLAFLSIERKLKMKCKKKKMKKEV